MIDFIDKTEEQSGTPINRKNMMGIQGFSNRSIIFKEDGSVTEEFENGEKLNTKVINFADITQTFSGQKNITKNLFMVGNIIQEEVK
jgi:hypothetical protein